MSDIKKICSSICNKAKYYNGCRYIENRIASENKLVGFLEGLEEAGIICDSVINKNYYKKISKINLTMTDNDQIVNIFIDVENQTFDIVKKTDESTVIKKVKI